MAGCGRHLDDGAAAALQPLHSLAWLNISGMCAPYLAHYVLISHCRLSLCAATSGTAVGHQGLACLSTLAALHTLLMADCSHATTDALLPLCTLHRLAVLSVYRCPLSDGSAAVLQQLPSLTWLDLGWTRMGKGTVQELAQLPAGRLPCLPISCA